MKALEEDLNDCNFFCEIRKRQLYFVISEPIFNPFFFFFSLFGKVQVHLLVDSYGTGGLQKFVPISKKLKPENIAMHC